MGIVAVGNDLLGVDVHIVAAFQIELQRHLRGKVEIGVERTRTVTRLHGLRRREFIDVVRTFTRPVQAFLDTVAFIPDLWEGQVDFRHDPRNIKPAGIADAAFVLGIKPWADERKAVVHAVVFAVVLAVVHVVVHVVASPERFCKDAKAKERGQESRGKVHFVGCD